MSDHSLQIERLRQSATAASGLTNLTASEMFNVLVFQVVADLLEVHDATGISLDNWTAPRALVEVLLGEPITENGA